MKFSDIPQLTKDGNYEITAELRDLENILDGYKQDYNLELNPDFQRGNVWTKDQQIAWLEFLFRGGKTSRVVYFNCPDWALDVSPDRDIENMYCVDGLQRLTAILGFLHNEIPIFGCYFKDFEDRMGHDYYIRININSLQTRKDVIQWYLDMNSGGTIHSQKELDRVRALLDDKSEKKDI